MKKFSIFIIFLLFLANPGFADVYDYPARLNSISTQIPSMGSIKCKFKQEKCLKNINKPIISGGDFEFVENKGVYFHTTYPVQSTVDYSNKNYKQVNDIVKAISSKKFAQIEKEFKFFFSKTSSDWTLGMKPQKTSNVENFIYSITVTGSDYINKICIIQTNGNKTTIWFIK